MAVFCEIPPSPRGLEDALLTRSSGGRLASDGKNLGELLLIDVPIAAPDGRASLGSIQHRGMGIVVMGTAAAEAHWISGGKTT